MRGRKQKLLGTAFALVMLAGCSDSNDPVPTPAFSVSFPSTSFTIQRGQSKTYSVSVSRTGGFTGTVLIAVTGLPQDLSVGCSPSSVLGSTATLTVAAGASQSLGAFTATVKATGTGAASQTTLLTINVIP